MFDRRVASTRISSIAASGLSRMTFVNRSLEMRSVSSFVSAVQVAQRGQRFQPLLSGFADSDQDARREGHARFAGCFQGREPECGHLVGSAEVRTATLAQPFGRRAEIACKLLAGDTAGALAAAEALNPRDAVLMALVQAAAGAAPPAAVPQTMLDGPAMMMLDIAHAPPPAAALQSTQPAMIRALVGHKSLSLATRIDIAERGEALAIVEATRLSDLYAQAVKEGATLPAAMARRAQLVTATRNAGNAQEIMSSIAAIYAGSVQDHRVRGLVLMAPHVMVEAIAQQSIARIAEIYETTDLRERLARHHG